MSEVAKVFIVLAVAISEGVTLTRYVGGKYSDLLGRDIR